MLVSRLSFAFVWSFTVKPSRLSHWLRVSVMLALCSFTAYACGGAKFTSGGGSGGTGAGGTGSVATGGSSGPKVACEGPEDCDDGNPCTVDECGADGVCAPAPKCGATEKCCDGTCGECCDGSDCDDQVKCTDDQCFAGGCTHSPDNRSCGADEYCSASADCRRKETCADDAGCDDGDACTDDTCTTSLLCEHSAAECADPKKSLCCTGVGCAECCEDSQCNDGDPCTKDSCSGNACSHAPFCADGQKCCAKADGKSATCGTNCCSATDCDDGVKCTKDSCTQGTCSYTDNQTCPMGFTCNPTDGCVKAAECVKDGDCKPTDCQTNGACVNGSCKFDPCATGTKCCAGQGCKACCVDTDCNDQLGCTKDTCNGGVCSNQPDSGVCPALSPICDPKLGCIGCNTAADCDDGVACTADTCEAHKCVNSKLCNEKCCCTDTDCQGGITTLALPIGTKCSYSVCGPAGMCTTKTTTCTLGGCCKYGCCGITTL